MKVVDRIFGLNVTVFNYNLMECICQLDMHFNSCSVSLSSVLIIFVHISGILIVIEMYRGPQGRLVHFVGLIK